MRTPSEGTKDATLQADAAKVLAEAFRAAGWPAPQYVATVDAGTVSGWRVQTARFDGSPQDRRRDCVVGREGQVFRVGDSGPLPVYGLYEGIAELYQAATGQPIPVQPKSNVIGYSSRAAFESADSSPGSLLEDALAVRSTDEQAARQVRDRRLSAWRQTMDLVAEFLETAQRLKIPRDEHQRFTLGFFNRRPRRVSWRIHLWHNWGEHPPHTAPELLDIRADGSWSMIKSGSDDGAYAEWKVADSKEGPDSLKCTLDVAAVRESVVQYLAGHSSAR